MGIPKFEELAILGEILRRAKFKVGDNNREDMVISHIRMLLDKADESYIAGMAEGFSLGQIRAMSQDRLEGFIGGPEKKDSIGE